MALGVIVKVSGMGWGMHYALRECPHKKKKYKYVCVCKNVLLACFAQN